jgi:hypothetical protein
MASDMDSADQDVPGVTDLIAGEVEKLGIEAQEPDSVSDSDAQDLVWNRQQSPVSRHHRNNDEHGGLAGDQRLFPADRPGRVAQRPAGGAPAYEGHRSGWSSGLGGPP